ncbi:hypothetical protein NUU61_008363 [Penicillium alfredii]|uniref:Uncharacterized protein n=1 Tax=Penicillium alfredii TaxID=1506179 RepID=A0A9W9ESH6_9EURO|nr:uncharacterized protein NUU61_008363 [Penicillium alfredii]KAJ5087056.1 hypothetical protein NUU61_008363 [Penicillium alfredii]
MQIRIRPTHAPSQELHGLALNSSTDPPPPDEKPSMYNVPRIWGKIAGRVKTGERGTMHPEPYLKRASPRILRRATSTMTGKQAGPNRDAANWGTAAFVARDETQRLAWSGEKDGLVTHSSMHKKINEKKMTGLHPVVGECEMCRALSGCEQLPKSLESRCHLCLSRCSRDGVTTHAVDASGYPGEDM